MEADSEVGWTRSYVDAPRSSKSDRQPAGILSTSIRRRHVVPTHARLRPRKQSRPPQMLSNNQDELWVTAGFPWGQPKISRQPSNGYRFSQNFLAGLNQRPPDTASVCRNDGRCRGLAALFFGLASLSLSCSHCCSKPRRSLAVPANLLPVLMILGIMGLFGIARRRDSHHIGRRAGACGGRYDSILPIQA